MKRTLAFLAKTSLVLTIAVPLLAFSYSCRPETATTKDIDLTSRTKYSGAINGSPIAIDVVATINTGRGGNSTCTFTTIPTGFNPATLGTHA